MILSVFALALGAAILLIGGLGAVIQAEAADASGLPASGVSI
jgi:hypothetical protein